MSSTYHSCTNLCLSERERQGKKYHPLSFLPSVFIPILCLSERERQGKISSTYHSQSSVFIPIYVWVRETQGKKQCHPLIIPIIRLYMRKILCLSERETRGKKYQWKGAPSLSVVYEYLIWIRVFKMGDDEEIKSEDNGWENSLSLQCITMRSVPIEATWRL